MVAHVAFACVMGWSGRPATDATAGSATRSAGGLATRPAGDAAAEARTR